MHTFASLQSQNFSMKIGLICKSIRSFRTVRRLQTSSFFPAHAFEVTELITHYFIHFCIRLRLGRARARRPASRPGAPAEGALLDHLRPAARAGPAAADADPPVSGRGLGFRRRRGRPPGGKTGRRGGHLRHASRRSGVSKNH